MQLGLGRSLFCIDLGLAQVLTLYLAWTGAGLYSVYGLDWGVLTLYTSWTGEVLTLYTA